MRLDISVALRFPPFLYIWRETERNGNIKSHFNEIDYDRGTLSQIYDRIFVIFMIIECHKYFKLLTYSVSFG